MGSEIKQKLMIFAGVLVIAICFLLPTALKPTMGTFNWISKPISLGLDLLGGVHLVFEVQAKEAVKSRMQITANSIRAELRKSKVAVTRAAVNERSQIEITVLSSRLVERAKEIIKAEFEGLNYVTQTTNAGRVVLRYGITPEEAAEIEKNAVIQSVETLRTRVDAFGVAEPLIQRADKNRIILEVPGQSDIEAVKNIVGSVARLEFRLLPNADTAPYAVEMDNRDGGTVTVEDEVRLTGEMVDDARVGVINGQVEVSLRFTSEGGRIFSKLTRENVNRSLAIILDGTVYSSPNINEPIVGGRASITGGFNHEEARQLAVILRAGALPAPLKRLEERTVGPTLGAESITKGIRAIIIGFAMIIVFMALYYKKCGVIAVSILGLNVVLVLAALSAFGATLTLPGMAGLALTIGMAVDANVIIFERIREELRNGSGRDAAVNAGFDRALSAIIDSNLTTLLAGVILYQFGTGPVKGFAVTLSVGILTTIYCATFVSRLAFNCFPATNKDGALSI